MHKLNYKFETNRIFSLVAVARTNYVIGRRLPLCKRIIRFFSRAVETAWKNLTRVNSRRTFDSTTRFDSKETSSRPCRRTCTSSGSLLRKKESFSTFSRQRLTCCCDGVRNVPFLPLALRWGAAAQSPCDSFPIDHDRPGSPTDERALLFVSLSF